MPRKLFLFLVIIFGMVGCFGETPEEKPSDSESVVIDEVDAQTESVAKKPRRRASSRAKSAKPKVATEPAAATTTEPPIALATTIAPIAEIAEKQSVEMSDNQSAGDVVAKEETATTTPPKAKRSVRRRPKKADQKAEQKTEQKTEQKADQTSEQKAE